MKTRIVRKGSTASKGLDEETTPSKAPEESSSPMEGIVEEPLKKTAPGPKIKKVIVKKKVVMPTVGRLLKEGSTVAAEIEQKAELMSKDALVESLESIVEPSNTGAVEPNVQPKNLDSISLVRDEEVVGKNLEAVVTGAQISQLEEQSEKTVVEKMAVAVANQGTASQGVTVEVRPGSTQNQPATSSASGKKVKRIVVIKKIVKRKRESVANPSVITEVGKQSAVLKEDVPQTDEEKELNAQQESVKETGDNKLSLVGNQDPENAPTTNKEEISTTDTMSIPFKAELIVDDAEEVKALEHDQQRPSNEQDSGDEEKFEHLQEGLVDMNERDEVPDEEEYEDLNEEMEGEYDLEGGQGDQQEGEEEVGIDEQGDIADFTLEYVEAQQVMPVSKKQKNRKFEVFVGGLDKDATEEDIKKAFEAIGDVTEVRLIGNPQTGKNKGYAFVRFASVAEAKRAATEFERIEVRGRECGILPNEENDILFVGNINKTWAKDQLEETLKKHGVENIEELTLMEDPQNEGANRGFAFIEFITHKDALNAFDRLRQQNILLGTDRFAKIAWAEPFNDPDEDVMAQVKSVFVEGLPSTWDEDRLRSTFGKYGEITRVVLSRNMPFAKRTDFAFVNYGTREAALACIEAIGSTEFVEGDSKVKLKVTLAKPPSKNRALKGGPWGGHPFGRQSSHFGTRGFYRGGRFSEGWGRGADRFWLPRAGLRGGRGYSRRFSRGGRFMGSYGDQHRSEVEKSHVKELLRVLREQATQEDEPSSSQKGAGQHRQVAHEQHKLNNGKPSDRENISFSMENQGAKAASEKYQCHMCGFCSDIESEYSRHKSSRVHKVIEEHRGDENLTNKTPTSLLHEYAARHRCEVHYDIKADDPLGPFEVLATIGGGGTGVPLTKGVAKGSSKSKARQMAAADALEKIMERVPDLQFGRAHQSKQLAGDGPYGAGIRGRSFRGGRGRGYSRGGGFEPKGDGRRYGLDTYGRDERVFDEPVSVGVRSRGSYRPRGPDYYEEEDFNDDRDARMRGPIDFHSRVKKRAPGRGQQWDRYGPSANYPESSRRERERSDELNVLAAHREAYLQRLGSGPGYDRTAMREYGETMPVGKRPYSVLEEDDFIDSHRANARARLEHIEPFPAPPGPSQYPGGSLYGTTSRGSSIPGSYIGGQVSQAAAYTLYDSHLPGVDVSGLYAGTGDYVGGLELAGASSYPSSMYDVYAQASSLAAGYSLPGTGSGALF